jgi:hypothetical protein
MPIFVKNLDDLQPARDLLRRRHKYFIGVLDPAASIEFSRGCPWIVPFAVRGPFMVAVTGSKALKRP